MIGKIIQENTFEQKKTKAGLELYPRLELIGLLTIDLLAVGFVFPLQTTSFYPREQFLSNDVL